MYREVRSTSAVELPSCSSIRRIARANLCARSRRYSARSSSAGRRGTFSLSSSASARAASLAACLRPCRRCTICPTGCAISTARSTRSATRWRMSSLRRRSCVFCVSTGDADDAASSRQVQLTFYRSLEQFLQQTMAQ